MAGRSRSPAARALDDAAPLFAALGDGTRLRLVARLCDEGPLPIVRLADGADVSRQAVTKHLRALEAARLVRSARSGRERIWELEPARLAEARAHLDRIARRWDEAIGRLRALVEGGPAPTPGTPGPRGRTAKD